MAAPHGFRREGHPSIVLRSRLRDLTSRMRTNPALQRMGKWLETLQADLRGAATERLHEAGTLASRVARQLLGPAQSGPRAIVNATGILTLNRAELPLADAALDEMALVARDYRTFDHAPSGAGAHGPAGAGAHGLADGHAAAGSALHSVEALVSELTGAEAALVFANPAVAMVAVLSALGRGGEALVSRAHIERLAGDFLLPDAARLAQIRLCEIGATHRTLAADYRAACGADTALILHSQPAEFALTGSVAQTGLDELVALAAGRQIPLVASLPSASLLPLSFTGASRLPLVGQAIVAGADLVLFRGDTCLGGPRVAIVAGRRALIERIAADPLAPIFAADSLSLTALAATLRLCASPQTAVRSIPLVQLLAASSDNLKHRAERLAPQIRHSALVTRVEVLPGEGWLSEARLPDERLPSWCLRIEARGTSAARLAGDLAERTPALWAQADDNYLTLNLRSVLPRQDEQIVTAFAGTGPRAAESSADAAAASSASTTDVLSSAE